MANLHSIRVSRRARYFVDPSATGPPREVWFLLHGYGQAARSFLEEFEPLRRAGRWLVAPEALSRFYVRKSDGRVGASWMTKEAREDEIADTLEFLDAVYREVLGDVLGSEERGEVSVHVLGFSQGAAAACRWGASKSVPVDRVISWAGGFPPDVDPASWPAETALALVGGTRDPWLAEGSIEQELQRLVEADLPHDVIRFEGGHELDAEVLRGLGATSSGTA